MVPLRPVPEYVPLCFPQSELIDPSDVAAYLSSEGILRLESISSPPREGILFVPQANLLEVLVPRGKIANLIGIDDILRSEIIGDSLYIQDAQHHSFALLPGQLPRYVHAGRPARGVPLALRNLYLFDPRLLELPYLGNG